MPQGKTVDTRGVNRPLEGGTPRHGLTALAGGIMRDWSRQPLNLKGNTMAERRVNVGWAEGLHARPASIFVRAATASGVPVTIAKADGTPVNAASMLAVLGLGAQGGEEIVLASDAPGAEEALDRLGKLVAEGLDELPETV